MAIPWPYDQGPADPRTTQAYRDWFCLPIQLIVPSAQIPWRRPRGQAVGRGQGQGGRGDGDRDGDRDGSGGRGGGRGGGGTPRR